jgi:hypothetical protein
MVEELDDVTVKLGLGYANLVSVVTEEVPSMPDIRNGLKALQKKKMEPQGVDS